MSEDKPNAPVVDAPAPNEVEHYGLLAEFEDVDTLLHAARNVRNAGYTQWDCFTPFPVHGLNQAMGLRHTRLPWIVLIAGLIGCGTGLVLQLWTMATSVEGLPSIFQGYPFIISGKPYASLPAFIPVTFELTILLAALAAFLGMLLMNKLPMLHHPTLRSERFRRVTNDRFFIAIETQDALFDRERTANLLRELGATHLEDLEQ